MHAAIRNNPPTFTYSVHILAYKGRRFRVIEKTVRQFKMKNLNYELPLALKVN